MFPTLQIGPLAIQTPGLVLILGLWIGLSLSEKAAPRHGVDPGDVYNLAFISLIAGIVGARLSFAFEYPDAFTNNLASLISLNPSLLDPWGGAAIGLIAAIIYGFRKKMRFWQTLDAYVPALAVFGVALGVAHLASGDAFGMPTTEPWGIQLWGARRQPVQLYEILLALTIFGIIYLRLGRQRTYPPGVLFLAYIAMAAGTRLFLEAFRGDSLLVMGGFRAAQILSWGVLAASLGGISYLKRAQPHAQDTLS